MGYIQKDAFKTMSLTYVGLLLGYFNKAVLFLWILSSEQIGLINLILSVSMLFAQFSNLGTINSIIKFFPFFNDSLEKKSKFIKINMLIVLIGIIIFSSLTIIFKGSILNFYNEKSKEFLHYYLWIIPIGIANVFYLILEYYLRVINKNVLAVFLYEFLLRFLISVLLIALWLKLIDFDAFFIIHCFLYYIPVLIIFFFLLLKKEIQIKRSNYNIPSKLKKIIYSYSLYSYANSLGVLFVFTIDSMMIASYLGLKATGVYTTMIYFSSALQIPYRSLIRISSPLIPKFWKERNMIEMQNLYQKFSSISFIIILYLFLISWTCKTELFSLLPKDFQQGQNVFFLLLIGRVVDIYCGLNGSILLTSKKYKIDLFLTILLMAIVIYLNYLFIPILGIDGAAYSTSIALIVYNIIRLVVVYYYYKLHPLSKKQFYVLIIFLTLMLFSSFLSTLIDFINSIFFTVSIKLIIVTIVFLLPIYYFKLENEFNKGIQSVFKNAIKIIKK